ncbi:TrmH family RNA methyltransferase [Amorphus orientalis]|uniref:23S rRNA (Guanosine2251-2'-O)-methyltransferase n=1 Tax=Amorphus orientalis TaxID=649198 RepID=A0AAE3VS64_9HYPH|nr:RNA methyltransferase [Amorphus orientalis]MDQ0317198.1 23S rRNA (guanosine2251-2'-O)-methyltransferase [Amorphus orientalis]
MAKPPHPKARSSRPSPEDMGPVWLYGFHTVAAALANPDRERHRLVVTRNALARLEEEVGRTIDEAEVLDPRAISKLVGADAVHQGVALRAMPLPPGDLQDLGDARLVVLLDQITDPHNVGAILRSATALGAEAVITTTRHSPTESGVMAKAASGALDLIRVLTVVNLARALDTLGEHGFARIALDSDGAEPLESAPACDRLALVLGAEGKGVRPGVKAACDHVARLDMPGPIKSLNVSNACVLALYAGRRLLSDE